MSKTIVVEGKTINEATEKGLKELGVRKEKVNIKVLEQEEKRSFFSILEPRVVKVEISLKENEEVEEEINEKEMNNVLSKIKVFLDKFIEQLPGEVKYKIGINNSKIYIDISGNNINYLIGHRGDVLNNLQTIISSISNNHTEERIRVILDIEGYKKKREKTLEELAEKISKTVIRTGKKVILEPMTAYERKIIHSKLQENSKVKTYSIGEEPRRKVVIELK